MRVMSSICTIDRYTYSDKNDPTNWHINSDSNEARPAAQEVSKTEFTIDPTEIVTDEIRRLSDIEDLDRWRRPSAKWSAFRL